MPVNLAQATPDPGLFDTLAENVAHTLDQEAGRSNKNKTAQIRRFYDELVGWQERIGGDEDKFKKYEAFIRMMNAKVAYAKGRELVGEEFERWFRDCIKSTTSALALDHFRLHFEAVLGFLKALRG
jgi:CRISPR-associated protein Csm2